MIQTTIHNLSSVKLKSEIKRTIAIVLVIIACGLLFSASKNNSIEKDSYAKDHKVSMQHRGHCTPFDERMERNYGYTICGETIDFEGLFGIRLKTYGSKVSYSPYTHNKKTVIDGNPYIAKLDNKWNKTTVKTLGKINYNEESSVDVSDLSDGVYVLCQKFDAKDGYDNTVIASFVVRNGKPKCCRLSTLDKPSLDEELKTWENFTKDMNPKDYLDTSRMSYPTEYRENYHAVKEICDLSDTLVKKEWTDEMKVFAFTAYIIKNYAYDTWRALKDKSRANIAGEKYDDPQYFTPNNYVGVCWDFTNILAIMCRHHGIACTSISNGTHCWNIIYLNGQWWSMDVTKFMVYQCQTEETNKSEWRRFRYEEWGHWYLVTTYEEKCEGSIDDEIWYYKN